MPHPGTPLSWCDGNDKVVPSCMCCSIGICQLQKERKEIFVEKENIALQYSIQNHYKHFFLTETTLHAFQASDSKQVVKIKLRQTDLPAATRSKLPWMTKSIQPQHMAMRLNFCWFSATRESIIQIDSQHWRELTQNSIDNSA
jgi:hypothetical protein